METNVTNFLFSDVAALCSKEILAAFCIFLWYRKVIVFCYVTGFFLRVKKCNFLFSDIAAFCFKETLAVLCIIYCYRKVIGFCCMICSLMLGGSVFLHDTLLMPSL